MKKISILLLFIFLHHCSGCNNDGNQLSKVCPNPKKCSLQDNIIVVYEQEPEILNGICSYGTTKCNNNNEITICEGYVGPITEICDQLDNDCDILIDEDFDKDEDTFKTCENDCDDLNYWTNPSINEICDNIDNNCNNQIDEDVYLECWSGANLLTFNELSRCKKGFKQCIKGMWNNICENEILPIEEQCNNIDDNCNNLVDEPVINSCGPLNIVGACKKGDQICSQNETLCINAIYPAGETCNGVDDDCNGIVDNDLVRRCNTICGNGLEICSRGHWEYCDAPTPSLEICDDIDNDCDGVIDNGCTCTNGDVQTCINGITDRITGLPLSCGLGIQICINGQFDICYFFQNGEEICNNWDDDCNGILDEIVENCGDTNTAGIGECRLGNITCSQGRWSECIGDILPETEICDRLDNDCDMLIDEDLNPHDKVDIIFAIDISGSMCPITNVLKVAMSNYVNDFIGTNNLFGLVTFPDNLNTYRWETFPFLTDVIGFQNELNNIGCTGGGSEPSYDVIYDLANPINASNIGWRPDAYPYIIIIGDENAQTWLSLTEQVVASMTSNCTIGSCSPGETIEIYIITDISYFSQWNDITFNDPKRLLEIYPPSVVRYEMLLRDIFSNICIN